jgi:type IV secretory pathway VirB10-like protein
MNKILKYSLIGLGVAAVGTTLYFVFRKPKDEKGEEGKTDEKEAEKKEESKDIDTTPSDTTSTTAHTKPAATKPTDTKPELKVEDKKIVNAVTKRDIPLSVLLPTLDSKTDLILMKGNISVISIKDGTKLLDPKKGNLLFTLKKGTNIGKYLGSKLLPKGSYAVYTKMKNGTVIVAGAANLKFA